MWFLYDSNGFWDAWHDANTTYFLCLEFIYIVFILFDFYCSKYWLGNFQFLAFLRSQLYLDINISPRCWDHAEVFSMRLSLLTSSNVSCFQLLACKTCSLGGVLVRGLSYQYVWENKDVQRREREKKKTKMSEKRKSVSEFTFQSVGWGFKSWSLLFCYSFLVLELMIAECNQPKVW